MRVHWLWLATRPGLSDRMRAELLERFSDAEDIYFADPEAYSQAEYLTPEGAAALEDKDLSQAQKILEDCLKANISILTYRDAGYPARLKNIPDPPVVLYYKGKLLDFDQLPLIGVVGTRSASAYGLTAAKRMGYQIAACGGILVSGMAFGIDGIAMSGALTADMPVVGVLGCGADIVYPLSNRALFADCEKNGCILTEFPPGTPPNKWNFPKRNRIISGLSCGVLVVEAPEKSGALITARQAADQGRDVFVVPGNIDVDSCKGSNALLRDGAIAATSGWEVVGEYEAQFPGRIHKHSGPAYQRAYPDEVERQAQQELPQVAQKSKIFGGSKKQKPAQKKKEIDNTSAEAYIDAEKPLQALTPQEEKIIGLIRQGACLVDDVIAQMDMPAASVLAALTMLQIKGLVKTLPGKRLELQGRNK